MEDNVDQKISVKKIIKILLNYRTLIISVTMFMAVTSIITSLLMPQWYKASVVILPPNIDGGGGMGIASLLSGLPFGGMGMDGVSQATNNYMSILNSRTLAERVVKEYDLVSRYDVENMTEAIMGLNGNTKYLIEDEGTTLIVIYDRDQERVAGMANYIVAQLDSINKSLSKERAVNNKTFIEKRLTQVYEEAAFTEDQLMEFQEENGIFEIEVQAEETIRVLAGIEAQIVEKEIELNLLKATLGSTHPKISFKKKEITALRQGLNDLSEENNGSTIFYSLASIPDQAIQYARLLRDVKAKNAVLEFLIPEYEQARIQEEKDTPTVQVLDPAIRPYKKSKPFRALIVMVSTMLGFFSSIYMAVFHYRHLREV